MHLNTFYAQVLNPNKVVALGLFPAVAMYNHSCDPNCAVMTCENGVLEVRCIRAVNEGSEYVTF